MELATSLIPSPWVPLSTLTSGEAFEQQSGDPRIWVLSTKMDGILHVCFDPADGGVALCSPSTVVRRVAVKLVPA